ncbi:MULTISPECIES: C39 family peptidase [Clostridium]|uniref:C39 family peptidase n=1 Tax=Clostridium cibarium TaxID=2762247 RepID=A0ABR8PVN9_9CLOT|nr:MULTISPECIES: C39 family peptidase [Clostridium]MBD7912251.1 C39 family peptidase [Clostridium cibarium]
MKKIKFNSLVVMSLVFFTLLTSGVTTQAKSSVLVNQSYDVTSKNYNYTGQALNQSWGLGKYQTEYVSNNKPYDWYIDQGNTGAYSDSNCGPSSTTMALKWVNGNFNRTAEDARNTYRSSGGWWYTDDVTNYLNLYNSRYSVKDLGKTIPQGEVVLKDQLKQGNIAILCIDTSYLPYNSLSERRVGKFYSYSGGHFIVVKGYRVVDGKTYFEVYDPNNWNEHYRDGQEKGKDRYYLSKDLMNAEINWWNYAIVVQPQNSRLSSSLNMVRSLKRDQVDITKIKSAYGR